MSTLESTPAVQVLKQSLEKGRLAHGILLQGDNLRMLEQVCHTMANTLLGIEGDESSCFKHPDFFTLRPQGKARFINVGSKSERVGGACAPNSMRRLISDLQLTPQAGDKKVAVIYEVDRMNNMAANAFLKTLEEPPKNTTLFLLTTRPYQLLATIRSRCLNFRISSELGKVGNEDWQQWLSDYSEWMHTLNTGKLSKSTTASLVLTVYGLISRFDAILKSMSADNWETYQETLPENLEADQKAALETGFRKSLRAQLFGEIEQQTRNYALSDTSALPAAKLTQAISQLEHHVKLLEVNLNESTALEAFLLKSLRIWAA